MDLSNLTLTEIDRTLGNLKNNNGVGLDGIPCEFFKFGGERVRKVLYDLYLEVCEEELVPAKWNESKVILLHKGGNKSRQLLNNYGPISLANTVGNFFCYILNGRMKRAPVEYKVIGEEHNGFREDRGGRQHLYY